MKIKIKSRDTKSVSVGIFVPTGSAFESESERGLAHFIEHMLFKGTKNRTYKDIASDIDRLGGSINAFTSTEYTVFYIRVLSDFLKEGYDVLSDIIRNSLIDEKELEKEKNVIIEEINMTYDNPDEAVYEIFMEKAVDGTYGRSTLGTKEHIKSYTRKDLLNFMGKYYRPENMVVSVVGGDVDGFDFTLNGFFFDEYRKEDGKIEPTFFFKPGLDIEKRDIAQANVIVGCELFNVYDERKYPAFLLNDSFGGTMSSRLFQSIREEKSLCYSIYSSLKLYMKGGLLLVSASTSNDKAQKLLDAIKDELTKLKKNGLTKREFEDAKTHFLGSYALGLESNFSVMLKQGMDTLLYGDYVDENIIMKKIKNVTMDDIQAVTDLIDLNKFHVTCLGNVDRLEW